MLINNMRFTLSLLLSLSGVLAQLREDVTDCGAYEDVGGDRMCKDQGDGCVGEGWFSKITKSPQDLQRVDANLACKEAGYEQGADEENYGGNWGQTCRYPGQNGSSNKAGGALNAFGFTVTWKCAGERGMKAPPAPTTRCGNLDERVVNCDGWSGECGGAGCRTSQGWYSSTTQDRKNAVEICREQGYSGEITKYGGNWGQNCRHPGTSKSVFNRAGGSLTEFGYTTTWFCDGSRKCKGSKKTMEPTMAPTEGCYDLDDRVIHCEGYNGNCGGSGCVRESGWYSKITRDRLDAVKVCKSQGYPGEIDSEYGGNWGQHCRYPGTSRGNPNRAGGDFTDFGFTVTWKCLGERLCDGVAPPTPMPVMPTPNPTAPKKNCPLREDVVDCGKYDGEECVGKGVGCVGRRWFSKVSREETEMQRINAMIVCKENGYDGTVLEYGGNWGNQCRHPGNNRESTNKAGGSLDQLGFTVSWRCEGKQNGCGSHKIEPTPEPTIDPTMPSPLPDHVKDCGRGWFSKIREPRINARQICRDMGYNGGVGDYGGNWGTECRYPGTGTLENGGTPNKAGGDLENFGTTVTWECKDLPDEIPDHVHACGDGWYSILKGTAINPTEVCKDLGYTGQVKDWGVHDDKLCDEAQDQQGGTATGLSGSVSWQCTDEYEREHWVHCGEYDGADCKNQGLGCVGDGWFSKTASPRVDARRICREEGYDDVSEDEYGGNWGNMCRYPGTQRGTGNKAGGDLTNFGMTVTWKCVGGEPKTRRPTAKPTSEPPATDCMLVFVDDVPKKYNMKTYMAAVDKAKCKSDCDRLQGKWKKKQCIVKANNKGPKVKCKFWDAKNDEIQAAICEAAGCKHKVGKKCDSKPKNLQK